MKNLLARFGFVGVSVSGAVLMAAAAFAVVVTEPGPGPTDLKATVGSATVSLSWTPPVGAVSHEVIRDGVVVATRVKATTWSTTSVTNGKTYFYVVRSVDAKGAKTKPSTEVKVTPQAPPPALTGVAVRNQDRQATVTWALPKNTIAQKVRATVNGAVVATVPAQAGVVTVKNLANNVSVLLSLETLNVNGTPSKPVTATLVPTSLVQKSPFGLTPTGGDARVDLVWLPTAGTEQYNLYRDAKLLKSVPGTATTVADTGLKNATVYKYQIQAVVGGQLSALSPAKSVTPLAIPAAPGPLLAQGRNGAVLLTWPAPTDPVAAYELRRGGVKVADIPGTDTTYTDRGLENGLRYTYTLLAQNANRAVGPESAPVSAVPALPPAAPSAPVAVAGDAQVTLTWPAVTGITKWGVLRDGVRVGGIISNALSFVDTSVRNDTTYRYQLVALSGDEQESPPSPVVTATPKAIPPDVPTGLRADVADSEVTLTWRANVPPAARYRLYRDGVQVAETTALTARDAALDNGKAYSFAVTALDGRGVESAPSQAVTATPVATGVDAPTLTAASGHEEALLTFGTASTRAVASWRILRDGAEVLQTTARTLPQRSLTDGKVYRYQVQALYADGGRSALSAVAVAAPLAPWRAVALGSDFACATHADGGVRCWGANGSRQVGDGSTAVSVNGPVIVVGPTGVTKLAAGKAFACAVAGDARLWCWGAVPGASAPALPAVVQGLTGVSAVGAGGSVACAVSAGSVFCWGTSSAGQLGATTTSASPVRITLPAAATDVAVGERHACALLADRTVACWGADDKGQASGAPSANRTGAVRVSGLAGVAQVSAGTDHTCVLTGAPSAGSGAVSCFGAGDAGQLGRPVATGAPSTVDLLPAVAVSAGDRYTCATLLSGQARCFGAGGAGQLGDGAGVDRSAPVPVLNLDTATYVAAGRGASTCALTRDGSLWCFGADRDGQLGLGGFGRATMPSAAIGNLSGATQLVVGTDASCMIRSAAVWCWGPNASGAAGAAPGVPVPTPVKVALPGTSQARSVAVGARTACVNTTTNELYCWGANDSGQAGQASGATVGVSKVALTGVSEAYVGDLATCARKSDGTVWCFGRSDLLGAGLTGQAARSAPAQVVTEAGTPVTGIVLAAMGTRHGCVIDRYAATTAGSGAVWCFGENGSGQVGGTGNATKARKVVGLSGAQAIGAGRAHTCAVVRTTSSVLQCFGANNAGQLGVGDTKDRAAPTTVPAMSSTKVSAAGDVTCVKSPNAQGWCFGAAAQGATGNGMTRAAEASPQVLYIAGGLLPMAAVSTNGATTCALLTSAKVLCWGVRGLASFGEGPASAYPTRPVVD
ncbi:hypothetical protein Val02_19010 [Virgisporangium aliadipatigenens]|uniref:Fibronectin type-III domain-containing protein n=1 Tax=Virgisporangium aliadipatigenens TaxID=741659 RepID=A0A8J3YJB7_9ACTN|nr:hypothetical protein [Virgisporangium aliadipatigenens]GIJ45015.1 hypothetical protein Val02_19010 [Virgisporangium aliadipatigenens]